MTTLEKETTVKCCCTGCKVCDPELHIKDLKGTVEGFQMLTALMFLLMFLMGIGIYATNDGRNYWKEEAKTYTDKYFATLRKNVALSTESTSKWQDSADLISARKSIQRLELEVMHVSNMVELCRVERGADAAQYEYQILKIKGVK